jgi:diguanylate cyclase (GGDEF)-like protein/putative nucleotidyltransferase with HDIG domain
MRVAAAAASASSVEHVIELASEAALELLPPGSLSVRRWERELKEMRALINVGELGPREERFPESETYAVRDHPPIEWLLRSRDPYFTAIDDPDACPTAVALLRARGKESGIGVAVVVEGAVWGEVWAATRRGAPRFRARDVRFLEAIAGQLANVISRAENFSTVSRLAFEDSLTGVASRAALLERLDGALASWRGASTPSTLLLCDVDELEKLNSSRGHDAGDRALRRVAEALVIAAAPLPGAVIGRMTGDEFAVLLDGGSLTDARELAAAAVALLAAEPDTPVTLSWGAALTAPGASTSEELLRAADFAQYAARRRGGGQLCTAEAAAATSPAPGPRRGHRRRTPEVLDETSARILKLLDGDLAQRSTLDRLELVISGFAEALNAAAWEISFAHHGATVIRAISVADDRDSRHAGLRLDSEDAVYELAAYPVTARLIRSGAGSFHIERHDGAAGPAEQQLLAELGLSAVLGVAISDPDGVYLLELFADGDTLDTRAADMRVQLLARAAAARSAGALERTHQLEKRTRQLAVTAALGSRLAGARSEAEVLSAAADELFEEFGFPVCGILRLTEDGQEVEIAAARGKCAARLAEAGWRQAAGLGLVGRALRERILVAVGDVKGEPDYRATTETAATRSELCAPLWVAQELWGAINLEHSRPHAFDDDDARLVRTLADQISAALRMASLYERLEQAYLGTAEALGAALEAKDAYTAGHSRNLANNAGAVGRALGMDAEALRRLRFGAAFHDIGKLAMPEAILNKPGRLDPDERAKIEQHTVIGDQILAPIEFLDDVRPIVRHGHERWDGCGYPDRLAGSNIPLGARIVFACDAFDAMTSDRPYRSALPESVALEELRRNAGSQFDPQVVEALLAVLENGRIPGV